MTHTCSWRRALRWSALVHLGVAGLLALGLADYAEKHPSVAYVIDLAAMDTEQGSGTAGGGASAASDLFPAPLAQQEINERIEQAARPAAPAAQTAVPTNMPAASAPSVADAAEPTDMALPAAGDAEPAAPSGGAAGTAVGSVGGEGSAVGAAGSGTGEESGAGTGYGEGEGLGEGSGDSGVSGTGSMPFDFAGFANAVEANKSYPYMAMRRGIEGSVTVAVTLGADGSLVGASVVSADNGLLADAAVQAVRAACPYPNASGAGVSFTTTLHFYLQ